MCECGSEFEQRALQEHMRAECSLRPVRCSFCDMWEPACEIQRHELECGSRTASCALCGQVLSRSTIDEETMMILYWGYKEQQSKPSVVIGGRLQYLMCNNKSIGDATTAAIGKDVMDSHKMGKEIHMHRQFCCARPLKGGVELSPCSQVS
eukprot:m51a1_g13361 hypothetical protein (151) ;mRNA; f:52-1532